MGDRREAIGRDLAGARREPRYAPSPGVSLAFLQGQESFEILDISTSAARVNSRPAELNAAGEVRLSWARLSTELSQPREARDGADITVQVSTGDCRVKDREILFFDQRGHELLDKLLPELKEKRFLEQQLHTILPNRLPRPFDVKRVLDKLRLDSRFGRQWPEQVEGWIEANRELIARMGPHAWPLTLHALEETFSTFFIDEELFERDLSDMVKGIVGQNSSRRLHAVPMRNLKELSVLLSRYKRIFDSHDIRWQPSLWTFVNQNWEKDDSIEHCLIAVDILVSRGLSRRKFLRLMQLRESQEEKLSFKRIYLAAVAGHLDALSFDQEAGPLKATGTEVLEVVGRQFAAHARSSEWQSFLDGLGMFATTPAPTKLLFHFGSTTDSIPLYWKRTDHWNPLFRAFMLRGPAHRPIPRARFFSAYPKTLSHLREIVNRGGVVLLRAQQGSGKTYLAAKLAELSLSSSYVFWHQCRSGAVEDLVENLDVFLDSLSVDYKLSPRLYKPQYEAELAKKLVSILRGLDRPAVLILDSFENIDLVQESGEGEPLSLTSFVSQLVRSLSHSNQSSVSEPCLLITHSGDVFDERTTARLVEQLGAENASCLYCPIDAEDSFEDALPLARKLIHSPSILDQYAQTINAMSHAHPYKTWLLCYWANRSLRHERPEDVALVLDSRFACLFADLTALHTVIAHRLTSTERCVLEAASAWRLPWSVTEMTESLRPVLMNPDATVSEVVAELIGDRAPFLSPLDSQIEGDGINPILAPRDGSIRPSDRFEMPSIAAKYFKGQLEQDRSKLCKVYQGIATAIAAAPGSSEANRWTGFIRQCT